MAGDNQFGVGPLSHTIPTESVDCHRWATSCNGSDSIIASAFLRNLLDDFFGSADVVEGQFPRLD